MVSPDTLRALCTLIDGDEDAFEPTVSERGVVRYPTVDRHLDDGTSDRETFLETMTDRGVLASAFEHKVYICPHCSAEGMQYSTGCLECGSVHAIEEPAAVHSACGTTLGSADEIRVEGDEPPNDDGAQTDSGDDNGVQTDSSDADTDPTVDCPGCGEVSTESIDREQRYRCHDCTAWFESPTHRLWCRDCDRVYPPADVTEEPLVRYPVTEFGRRWITEQVERRKLLAETLETRGYETSVDTTVSTSTGNELPVHISAVDDLFDARLVSGVHASPTVADIKRLVRAAHEADAQPILLLTDGAVDERISELCETEEITVVSGTDGMLSNEYETSDRARNSGPIAEWLESLFSPSKSGR